MGDVNTDYHAKIYDFSGRLINQVFFKHKINVNDLSKGINILKIESEDKSVVKKFKLD